MQRNARMLHSAQYATFIDALLRTGFREFLTSLLTGGAGLCFAEIFVGGITSRVADKPCCTLPPSKLRMALRLVAENRAVLFREGEKIHG
jgi:hypothetical protein